MASPTLGLQACSEPPDQCFPRDFFGVGEGLEPKTFLSVFPILSNADGVGFGFGFDLEDDRLRSRN